ncbi:MAG: glycosyltransferase [Bacteroidetes bacterium]|nr:glycosyltransferase [Bacteroidota bacterium]
MRSAVILLREIRNEIKRANTVAAIASEDTDIFYSYWASNEALLLAILRKKGLRTPAITRLHAYDIYEETQRNGRIPFRWFIYKNLDRLYPISMDGKNYLTRKYSEQAGKVHVSYLGTKSTGVLPPPMQNGVLRVISCGRVTSHKRHIDNFRLLNKIPNAEWWHVGDGEELEDLKRIVEKDAQIKVQLLGNLTQPELYNLYATTPFTCFLSLSSTEGIPVSMMEAISMGIPVVSTDVGGCREIVTDATGILLKENYSASDFAASMEKIQSETYQSVTARERIRNFWNTAFNADTNYSKWIEELINIKQRIK